MKVMDNLEVSSISQVSQYRYDTYEVEFTRIGAEPFGDVGKVLSVILPKKDIVDFKIGQKVKVTIEVQ
jgi:hypothetical protein